MRTCACIFITPLSFSDMENILLLWTLQVGIHLIRLRSLLTVDSMRPLRTHACKRTGLAHDVTSLGSQGFHVSSHW